MEFRGQVHQMLCGVCVLFYRVVKIYCVHYCGERLHSSHQILRGL